MLLFALPLGCTVAKKASAQGSLGGGGSSTVATASSVVNGWTIVSGDSRDITWHTNAIVVTSYAGNVQETTDEKGMTANGGVNNPYPGTNASFEFSHSGYAANDTTNDESFGTQLVMSYGVTSSGGNSSYLYGCSSDISVGNIEDPASGEVISPVTASGSSAPGVNSWSQSKSQQYIFTFWAAGTAIYCGGSAHGEADGN